MLEKWIQPGAMVLFAFALSWIAGEYRRFRKDRESDRSLTQSVVNDLRLCRSEMLSKDDHDEICEKRQEDITERIKEIKDTIDANNDHSREYRHSTRDQLEAIYRRLDVRDALEAERAKTDVKRRR